MNRQGKKGPGASGFQLDRRQFLALAGVGTTAPLAERFSATAQTSEKRPPNVIVFLTDDQGYGDLGCYGCSDIPTPNIDSIAANGVRFSDGYVTSPSGGPSRAALLTGRYNQRFGYEYNFSPRTWFGTGVIDANRGLPFEEITIADILKSSGYVTGAIGKWHLGMAPDYHPMSRGFDEFYGILDTAAAKLDYQPNNRDNPVMKGTKLVAETIPFLTEEWTKAAVAFVERCGPKPFFLYLAYDAPHFPQEAPQNYLDKFKHISDQVRRSYAATVSAIDHSVGEVLGTLKGLNLMRDTLVFFLSDSGGNFKMKDRPTGPSNGALRGFKTTFWEGGIRVPILLQWLGQIKGGQIYRHPVISLDVLSTVAAAAGAKLPADRKIDGLNLIPYLTGLKNSPPHEILYWREMEMFRCFRKGYAVRNGIWKLVKTREAGEETVGDQPIRLFDLSADIAEKNDLAGKNPKVVQQLTEALSQWESGMSSPRWPRWWYERPH